MPTILIIVGITGDLASRKLLPAIDTAAENNLLPEHFRIVGTTRQSHITLDTMRGTVGPFVREHLEFFQMDVQDASAYQRLAEHLREVEKQFAVPAQRLFYLSIPPEAAPAIIEKLGESGLAQVSQTKILLEKPSGVDLASATTLIAHIDRYFNPAQVYRIDHYLAKDIAEELVANNWNKDSIERIDIRALEKLGVEGRADFYEQTGALRDLVQSHLLELLALVCLDKDVTKTLPERRREALAHFFIPSDAPLQTYVRRGQYEGYREEVGNPKSVVETYVRMSLRSRDPRFAGIPLTLTTGKKLGEKITDVRIRYKDSTEKVFTSSGETATGGYVKVLLDALHSDQRSFVSSDEVLASWRIIAPVQEAWQKSSADLFIYPAGIDPSPLD